MATRLGLPASMLSRNVGNILPNTLTNAYCLAGAASFSTTADSLKTELLSKLSENAGSITADPVPSLIEELKKANPTKNAATSPLLLGNFKQMNASNFPNKLGLDNKGNAMYTLGRMSFNSFQPIDLPISVTETYNRVYKNEANDDIDKSLCYDLLINLKINGDGNELFGAMLNQTTCSPSDKNAERLNVSFCGGKLMPAGDMNEDDLHSWCQVFGNQNAEVSWKIKVQRWLGAKVFGLSIDKSDDTERGVLRYSLKKPPRGFVDIFYLDEEMRITQGNRKTIVVAMKQE